MKKALFVLLLLSTAACTPNAGEPKANAPWQETLHPGTALLFRGAKTRLAAREKNEIFALLEFRLSADKKGFILEDYKDPPFSARVWPTDLNGDKIEEIFVFYGNSYTSGLTGSSVALFIKKAGEKYKAGINGPFAMPDVLPSGKDGYPDLVTGGPGFTFPVWKWNGTAYESQDEIENNELVALKTKRVDQVSRLYQRTVK